MPRFLGHGFKRKSVVLEPLYSSFNNIKLSLSHIFLRLTRVSLAVQVSTKRSGTADTMIRKTHQLDDREIVCMVF